MGKYSFELKRKSSKKFLNREFFIYITHLALYKYKANDYIFATTKFLGSILNKNTIGMQSDLLLIKPKVNLSWDHKENIARIRMDLKYNNSQFIPISILTKHDNKRIKLNDRIYNVMINYIPQVGTDVTFNMIPILDTGNQVSIHFIETREGTILCHLHTNDTHDIKIDSRDMSNEIMYIFNKVEKSRESNPILDFLSIQNFLHEINTKSITGPNVQVKSTAYYLIKAMSKYSDQIAIDGLPIEKCSFGKLYAKVKQLNEELLKSTVEGDVIAIRLQPSSYLIALVISCIITKRVFLLIDPNTDSNKENCILNTINPEVFIKNDNGIINRITPQSYSRKWSVIPTYVIYSSGTTGKPKGIIIQDSVLANLISHHLKHDILSIKQRTLLFASINFDVSIQTIITSICTGSELYLIDNEKKRDIQSLINYILQFNIKRLYITPTVLSSLLQYVNIVGYEFDREMEMICAGEQLVLTKDIIKMLDKNVTLINQYGPSETHVVTEFILNNSDKLISGDTLPIGKPIQNCQVYLKEAGYNYQEILISGACIGLGYLGQKILTEAKFIEGTKSKIYKSGDYGYLDEYGNLIFKGRIDDTIKIKGKIINLNYLDSVLQSHHEIRKSYVFKDKSNRLIAFLETLNTNPQLLVHEIFSEHGLNEFTPDKVIVISEIPINTNGKVDKNALEKINDSESFLMDDDANDLQKLITNTVNIRITSFDDDVRKYGIDSLSLTMILVTIEKEYDISISVSEFLENPTINKLSHLIENKKTIHTKKERLNTKLIKSYISAPASQVQKNIYSNCLAGALYNMTATFSVNGYLDEDKLKYAFKLLISRYRIFRSGFEYKHEKLLIQEKFSVEDFTISTLHTTIDDLDKSVKSIENKRINMLEDILIALTFIKVNGVLKKLNVTVHHSIFDGISLGYFITELKSIYNECEYNTVKNEFDFLDYCAWESNYLTSNKGIKKIKALANLIKCTPININYRLCQNDSNLNGITYFEINETITERLNLQCTENKISSVHILLLHCFFISIKDYIIEPTVLISTLMSGRFISSLNNDIGPYYRAHPICLHTHRSTQQTLNEIARKVNYLYNNPIVGIYPALELINNIERKPHFSFNFSNDMDFIKSLKFQDATLNYEENSSLDNRSCHLNVIAVRKGKKICVRIQYLKKYFSEDFMELFVKNFNSNLS